MRVTDLSLAANVKIILAFVLFILIGKIGNNALTIISFFVWAFLAERIAKQDLKRQDDEQRADFFRYYQEQANASQTFSQTDVRSSEFRFANVLELNGNLQPSNIKKQYRRLIKMYHPDRAGWLDASQLEIFNQRAKEINEAYSYFKDNLNIL